MASPATFPEDDDFDACAEVDAANADADADADSCANLLPPDVLGKASMELKA